MSRKILVVAGELPNLDAMHEDDLLDFWLKHRKFGDAAQTFFTNPEVSGATRVMMTLARYALQKHMAMHLRLGGFTALAIQAEHELQALYNSIPQHLRW